MIIERTIPNINNHQIIIQKKPIPQSSNKSLPQLFNTSLFIGSKGRGKTYSLVELLNMYEKSVISDGTFEYKMRVILIAPTAYSSANSIYQTLTSMDKNDIHLEHSDELLKCFSCLNTMNDFLGCCYVIHLVLFFRQISNKVIYRHCI